MSSSASESTVHGVEVPKFFRAGVPAIVLSIVAILFIGVSTHSFFIVQPGILQRYRDICERNLQALEQEKEPPTREGLRFETPEVVDSNEVAGERRRLLEQTHFCLRRLIMSDNKDDALRFQSANVCDQLADWYLNQARSVSQEEPNNERVREIVARSQVERKKAADAMRVTLKLNGSYADEASLWLTRRQLVENFDLLPAELDTVAERVAKIMSTESYSANTSKNPDATQLLGQIRVLQALSFKIELSLDVRIKFLKEADRLFTNSELTHRATKITVEMQGWATEAKVALDPVAGQEVANNALPFFWAIRDTDSLSVESLASVFQCLLAINSIKESQLFLSDNLRQLSPIDHAKFRALTAAGALRHIASRTIYEMSSSLAQRVDNGQRENVGTVDTQAASRLDAVISMAIQLNPDSLELLALLERFAKPGDDDVMAMRLKEELGLNGVEQDPRLGPVPLEQGSISFLSAVIGLGSGKVDKSIEGELVTAVKTSPAYAVVACRLLMRMVSAESLSSSDAIRWLKTINVASPEVLVAWSNRANLHLRDKQFQEAIVCYEFLLEKLPGNEQLTEALEAAKKQLQNGN